MLKFDYYWAAALTSIPQEVLTFQWQEVQIDFRFNHFAKKLYMCIYTLVISLLIMYVLYHVNTGLESEGKKRLS